jgi:hypothetical protein
MVLSCLLVSATNDTWLGRYDIMVLNGFISFGYGEIMTVIKGCDFTGFSHMGHLAGALAGLMVGLVALENRKVEGL